MIVNLLCRASSEKQAVKQLATMRAQTPRPLARLRARRAHSGMELTGTESRALLAHARRTSA